MPKVKPPPEWGIEPVPKSKKILNFLDLFIFWTSLAVGLLVLQAGAFLAQDYGLSFEMIVIVTLVGSFIGSLILALVGVIGSKYGVTTMVSLRPSFGLRGSYLPTALNVLQLLGWTTFELIIMGEAATAVVGNVFGAFTRQVMVIVFALWCYLLMVSGPLTVIRQWLEKVAIWVSTITTLWLTYIVFSRPLTIPAGEINLVTLPLALDLVIAMPVSWMPLISDYNRFAKDDRHGFAGTLLGYVVANSWFYIVGAGLWFFSGGESVVYSIALLALGNLALIALLVDETDNGFADIYSATVSLQNMYPKRKQWKIGLMIVALSTSLALTIEIAQYTDFLLLIGAAFIPVFGVVFADYFVIRRRAYSAQDFYPEKRMINIRAIISWALGFVTYYYFAYIYAVGGTLPSLAIAFISYTLLSRSERKWKRSQSP